MVVTCMMTLVTRIGPEHQKGVITGIFRSLGALARACGPIVASSGIGTILNPWKFHLVNIVSLNMRVLYSSVLVHRKFFDVFNRRPVSHATTTHLA